MAEGDSKGQRKANMTKEGERKGLRGREREKKREREREREKEREGESKKRHLLVVVKGRFFFLSPRLSVFKVSA